MIGFRRLLRFCAAKVKQAGELEPSTVEYLRAFRVRDTVEVHRRLISSQRICREVFHGFCRIMKPGVQEYLLGFLRIRYIDLRRTNIALAKIPSQEKKRTKITIQYRLPKDLGEFILSVSILWNPIGSTNFSLTTHRVVPRTSNVLSHAVDGNIERIKELSSSGQAHPRDISDCWFWTPLHYAVSQGHVDLCRLLLCCGARADMADREGTSATHT